MISEPVVVGAGPAGLAVAATLARQGRPCVVLDQAESVGASWQGRYDSLRLHTVRWLSGLPGAPIPGATGDGSPATTSSPTCGTTRNASASDRSSRWRC